MKDNLYDILYNLTTTKSKIEGMLYVLGMIVESLESRNQFDEAYAIQLLIESIKNVEQELLHSINNLDKCILSNRISLN